MGLVKVFLVENQLLMRQAIARALSVTEKYEVVGHSSDGKELLSNPTSFNPDVIILDMMLARHSLLETLQRYRSQGITAPILVLAGEGQQSALDAALEAGACGVLPKCSGLGEMEHAIDTIANGETYVSPTLRNFSEGSTAHDADNSPSYQQLSPREREIFLLLAQGKKNREIGKALSISTRTVDTHRSNILKKLQVRSNAELVRMAIAEGVMSL
jgi:DNA-binding NarL/FixJ family response regulator